MVKKLYPNGKRKAVILSYDDGVEDDIELVSLMNKYHLKGTFNLNSGLMANHYQWTTEKGYVVKRLDRQAAVKLYKGHEIASHSLTHPFLRDWKLQVLFGEISVDKENLGAIFNKVIHGFAIPFDYYDCLVTKCVKESRFEYMRTSTMSHNFNTPKDYYKMDPTVFHLEPKFNEIVDKFIDVDQELACLYIVGHSYDLRENNLFAMIEDIFKKLSSNKDIISLTTHQYVSYLKAMDEAIIKKDEIINQSKKTLWFEIDNKIISIPPNESFKLNN